MPFYTYCKPFRKCILGECELIQYAVSKEETLLMSSQEWKEKSRELSAVATYKHWS